MNIYTFYDDVIHMSYIYIIPFSICQLSSDDAEKGISVLNHMRTDMPFKDRLILWH